MITKRASEDPTNPLGLRGIDFVEFASPRPDELDALFRALGFSRVMRHAQRAVDLYVQGQIHLLLDREPGSFASRFAAAHGPCISSMGWRFSSPKRAFAEAVMRGATAHAVPEMRYADGVGVPAIEGIGGSLIHFVDDDRSPERWAKRGFERHPEPMVARGAGFLEIDHLTNNVHRGTMARWVEFYRGVFGFTEVRTFDIRGEQTGLTSYALRSPDGSFCIPINEADEDKSQINEYLEAYKGPGVQHLAFSTADLLSTLAALDGSGVETLDIDDEYYRTVFDRVPNVREDREAIRRRQVLVDGDASGYLLQIFTENLVGPIFFELIQRENHLSFGEGNFGALFRSIERDQEKRGVFAEAR